jgi:DNA-binding CsgD family transcriptional regulator
MNKDLQKVADIQDFVRVLNQERLISDTGKFEFPHHILEQLMVYPNQFFYVLNVPSSTVEYMSPHFEKILGYPTQPLTVPFLYEIVHPEDLPIVLEAIDYVYRFVFTHKVRPFLNSFQMDYRVKHSQGHYVQVLRQTMGMVASQDMTHLYNLSICTDISSDKKQGPVEVSFSGEDVKDAHFSTKEFYAPTLHPKLNPRELEILQHLSQAKTSEDIGKELFISKNTVDTHRRNLLHKLQAKNTLELILFAQTHDLIA